MTTGLTRLIHSTRLDLLAFTLPPGWLLARCGGTGGWLMVIAWCALAVVFGVLHAKARARPFVAPPHSPSADPSLRARGLAHAALVLGVALSLAAGVTLLFVRAPVGIYVLLGLTAAMLAARRGSGERGGSLDRAPLLWPLGLIALPCVLLTLESRALEPIEPGRNAGSSASTLTGVDAPRDDAATGNDENSTPMAATPASGSPIAKPRDRAKERIPTRYRHANPAGDASLGASALCAASLAVYLLVLCARDAATDAGAGARTLGTTMGRPLVSALALVLALAAVGIACAGASPGATWWHWSVPLCCAWASALIALSLGAGAYASAAWVWLLGQTALGVALIASA